MESLYELNNALSDDTIPTPYAPSLDWRFATPTQKFQSLLSQERV